MACDRRAAKLVETLATMSVQWTFLRGTCYAALATNQLIIHGLVELLTVLEAEILRFKRECTLLWELFISPARRAGRRPR